MSPTLGSVKVQERYVEIPAPGGVMKTFMAQPDGVGPFDAVVLVQHVGGLSETMQVVARRVAAGGFVCAVPALHYRLGDIVVDPMSSDADIAAIRTIAVRSLGREQVMGDIRALLDFMAAKRMARRGLKGCIGIGGCAGYAFHAAAAFPNDFSAVAAVLGAGFVNDTVDSPHLAFPRVRGELYFSFAGRDEILPAANIDTLRSVLGAAAVPARIVVHPGVRHGYAFSNRAVYDEVAAEADWTFILSMFERQLAKTQETQHG